LKEIVKFEAGSFFPASVFMKMLKSEDRSEYVAPGCAVLLCHAQEMLAVSPDASENADVDPFIGGGNYEW
jgi:hypothetical protein